MESSKPSSFRVGLIQMRSGRSPQANTDMAARLIGQAKDRGAEYVLTPEMTNIMETGRERFFASIVPEEQDAALMTFRELARTLGMFVHVGSLAIKVSADKAANRRARTCRASARVPGTTRSTCSTSTSPAARATGNPATTVPASLPCSPTCRGVGSA